MKHATAKSLDRINSLLDELRSFGWLIEKTRGVFYFKSRAFLHFHEDHGTMYADVQLSGQDFDRFCLETLSNQRRLVAAIRRQLADTNKVQTGRSNRSRVKMRASI